MSDTLKIALVYPTSLPWLARLVDGVRRYGLQYGGWNILTSPLSFEDSGERPWTLHSLIGWDGDGAIATVRSEEDRQLVSQLGIPVVNLSDWDADPRGIPRVSVNNRLAGRLAAEHLLERGLQHFGFVGLKGVHYSEERFAGFNDRILEEGLHAVARFDTPEDAFDSTLAEELTALGRWLESLPQQCGILAVHDYWAQLVMEACAAVGLRVPRDVAVIGMDDDSIVCERSIPTLTSVCWNSSGIAWEAAALIDRMVQGAEIGSLDILVPPEGITERQSTALYHHPDEVI